MPRDRRCDLFIDGKWTAGEASGIIEAITAFNFPFFLEVEQLSRR